MKTFLALLTVLFVVVWFIQHQQTAALQTTVVAARAVDGEKRALSAENERLRQLLPSATERTQLQRASAEHDVLQREITEPDPAKAQAAQAFARGRWSPVREWKFRGQATPVAAIETALWAAAGGDLASLQAMLELAPETRVAAEAVRERLPPDSRALYTSAEHLVAAFTIKAIPLGEAQLLWQECTSPTEATIGLSLNDTTQAAPTAKNEDPRFTPRSLPGKGSGASLKRLTLRKSEGAWRLLVPPDAVTSIARELGSSP